MQFQKRWFLFYLALFPLLRYMLRVLSQGHPVGADLGSAVWGSFIGICCPRRRRLTPDSPATNPALFQLQQNLSREVVKANSRLAPGWPQAGPRTVLKPSLLEAASQESKVTLAPLECTPGSAQESQTQGLCWLLFLGSRLGGS